ncbi:Predicted dehydrogenase [Lutibacter agarilyticus]|uniref:Predicted dehydrogenase n=1 Tax=Lutibacter agarilyticus TaxID=1109740 RepID=A0A238Z2T6_9FLAO|nr:Gfo/Idh/MocA family oxidoreductase [Lutibacter agarilyticus]SNR77179.1 Predicted dehydrogenase [Lutibacter agarilyticus]
MSEQKIKWGIIGCGDVAEVKSGPAFQKAENSELTAVMRRDAEKVKDFANRHKVVNWYTDAVELLKNEAINAIYVATPPSTHLQYALDALKAGKNVYIEKPMVLNSTEAEKLCEAVENASSKVTVAHYRRCLPAFLKVKELIASNSIGTISLAEIQIFQPKNTEMIAKSDTNWRVNPSISGGGYFHDIAPHQIDLMCYYFGEVKIAEGFTVAQNNESNNLVNGIINFENGVQFKGTWNFNAPVKMQKDNCTIVGSKGTISFSFYGEEVVTVIDGKQEIHQFTNPIHVQQPMIEKTVAYFLGNESNPCSVEEGLMVTEIMDKFCGK